MRLRVPHYLQLFCLGFAAFWIIGCGGPTLPSRRLTIVLRSDSIVTTTVGSNTKVQIDLRVTNDDHQTVFFETGTCRHSVWQQRGSDWTSVWTVACRDYNQPSYAVDPGQSIEVHVIATASAGTTSWPAANVDGTYRVLLWVTDIPKNSSGLTPALIATESRMSPPFRIYPTS